MCHVSCGNDDTIHNLQHCFFLRHILCLRLIRDEPGRHHHSRYYLEVNHKAARHRIRLA